MIELFGERLGEVRFAEIDHACLLAAAEAVAARCEEVERQGEQVERQRELFEQQQAELTSARAALARAEDQLWRRTEQALAYARIYAGADGDAALARELDQLHLPPRVGAAPCAVSSAAEREPASRKRRRAEPDEAALSLALDGVTASGA